MIEESLITKELIEKVFTYFDKFELLISILILLISITVVKSFLSKLFYLKGKDV